MGYPGGKNGSGVYQWIINQIPPHDGYAEPFLGGGAILQAKRPALSSIAVDLDPVAVRRFQGKGAALGIPDLTVIQGDGIEWLEDMQPVLSERDFVYLDPPYLMSTRKSQRDLYAHELSDDDHRRLLAIILNLRCMVAISGYWSEMYNEALESWRSSTFNTMTRGGSPATEYLWMNYAPPVALHDYRYLGYNFRERERIKRKKTRWLKRLETMPDAERYAMLAAIDELRGGSVGKGMMGEASFPKF
jgi:16S rRNA G966 N2-methylase RsmD